jgi:hypothetical protein
MMTTPRRLRTVHDLSSLQFRPSGSCVQQHDHNVDHHYPSFKDKQANWIPETTTGTGFAKRHLSAHKRGRAVRDVNADSDALHMSKKRKHVKRQTSARKELFHEWSSLKNSITLDASCSVHSVDFSELKLPIPSSVSSLKSVTSDCLL